jgi:hypothetical protein
MWWQVRVYPSVALVAGKLPAVLQSVPYEEVARFKRMRDTVSGKLDLSVQGFLLDCWEEHGGELVFGVKNCTAVYEVAPQLFFFAAHPMHASPHWGADNSVCRPAY